MAPLGATTYRLVNEKLYNEKMTKSTNLQVNNYIIQPKGMRWGSLRAAKSPRAWKTQLIPCMGIGNLLIWILSSDGYLRKYKSDFYKQKLTSKLLKLSTQTKHINMDICAKIFRKSASE